MHILGDMILGKILLESLVGDIPVRIFDALIHLRNRTTVDPVIENGSEPARLIVGRVFLFLQFCLDRQFRFLYRRNINSVQPQESIRVALDASQIGIDIPVRQGFVFIEFAHVESLSYW